MPSRRTILGSAATTVTLGLAGCTTVQTPSYELTQEQIETGIVFRNITLTNVSDTLFSTPTAEVTITFTRDQQEPHSLTLFRVTDTGETMDHVFDDEWRDIPAAEMMEITVDPPSREYNRPSPQQYRLRAYDAGGTQLDSLFFEISRTT